LKVKEVAALTGISVRALHYYDEIGLLKPEKKTEAGYRIYSDKDLDTLQQILFFRELDIPLKKIKKIVSSSSFDRKEALKLHRSMLLEKRRRLDKIINTIDKTIQYAEGKIIMTNKEKFAGFDFSHNPYDKEARERFGDKAVNDTNAAINNMSDRKKKEFEDTFNAIYRELAAIRHEPPESDIAQAKIKVWYDFLNKIGDYSPEAFKGLGELYVADQRFTENIDQFGEGLTIFLRDAMAAFADRQNK